MRVEAEVESKRHAKQCYIKLYVWSRKEAVQYRSNRRMILKRSPPVPETRQLIKVLNSTWVNQISLESG